MERITFEEHLAALQDRAAQQKALEAMPQPESGTAAPATPGPMGRVAGAAQSLASGMESAARPITATIGWVKNLPKNIGKGALDAGVNTLRAANDIADTLADFHSPGETQVQDPDGSFRPAGPAEVNRMDVSAAEGLTDPSAAYDAWRASLSEDDNLGDSITQGIAQFMLPFTAYMKASGGVKGLSTMSKIAKLGAVEGATVSTAWNPHDPRLADLIDLGRHSESKFGQALNAISPDGSLLNAYIDYMTDRDGETAGEGRFKNVVDSLAGSAAVAGILKSAGLAFRVAKEIPTALKSQPVRPGSLKAQEGKIVFHGTPHDFDEFDIGKIGTGEGNQAYGYGLYFAEDKGVAKGYKEALTAPVGLTHRGRAAYNWARGMMKAAGGDKQKAYKAIQDDLGKPYTAPMREQLEEAARMIRAGYLDPKGKLMSVDIPDEAISRMLDWDGPFSSQPPSVQQALKKLNPKNKSGQTLEELLANDDVTGNEAYKMLANKLGAAEASKTLQEAGVPGISYLDGTSRKAGEGTRNIVLFDGKLATVKSKE